jgi:predicted transcriptional regulator
MVKNITRTISTTKVTFEAFLRKERMQTTLTMEFPETFKDEDEAQNFLYKRYEKGANEMPLFIHELTTIDYKYSMPLEKFMEESKVEIVTTDDSVESKVEIVTTDDSVESE